MSLLLYIRNILLLETEKMRIFKNILLLIQKNDSEKSISTSTQNTQFQDFSFEIHFK